MEIKKDFNNKLARRREVEFILDYAKNPSFVEMTKLVADNFKVSEEQVLVENIKGAFGAKSFVIVASIYENKELKDAAEKRMIKVKKVATPAQ
jgi:ribosomal protein S24E